MAVTSLLRHYHTQALCWVPDTHDQLFFLTVLENDWSHAHLKLGVIWDEEALNNLSKIMQIKRHDLNSGPSTSKAAVPDTQNHPHAARKP